VCPGNDERHSSCTPEKRIMRKKLKLKTSSEYETIRLGEALGARLKPGDVILLIGDLGSGKTRFAKGIVSKAAGVEQDDVVSPTFTLINCFEGAFPVCHADLYRLEPEHLDGIGLEDTLDRGGAIVVEWADKIRDYSEDPLTVFIMYGSDEEHRQFILEWEENGSWDERLAGISFKSP
jgi:tRNA threonylcarbamoyladenosine biosynthesis protein TsaE